MKTQPRQTKKGLRGASVAAATLALGGLSLSAIAVAPAGAQTSRAAKAVVVKTVTVAKYGTVLVDGKTLYTLKPAKTGWDRVPQIWPQVLLPKGVTKATAGPGVSSQARYRKGGRRGAPSYLLG